MSVNEIDVNAVNERTRRTMNEGLDALDKTAKVPYTPESNTAGTTPTYTRLSSTWKGRYMYFILDVHIFFESLIWTIMDIIRARRMRWAQKIKDATDQTATR